MREVTMRGITGLIIVGWLGALSVGCGGDREEPQSNERGHVWQGQTQALETARDVAQDIENQQSAMEDRLRRSTDN